MTAQARTSLYLEGNHYYMLGTETNKFLLDGGEFIVPREMVALATSNWKGYYITYFVEDKQLYGVMYDHFEEETIKHTAYVYSNQVALKYTGACIIAMNVNDRIKNDEIYYWDYPTRYVEHDYAYELFFEDGVLQDIVSLRAGIEEIERYDKLPSYKTREDVAKKYLGKRYGDSDRKAEYKVIVDENVQNNMSERIREILGVDANTMIKYQNGISLSFNVGALDRDDPFEESVLYIELMLKRKEEDALTIKLSMGEDGGTIHFTSPYEEGYAGDFNIVAAKDLLRALKESGIIDCGGGGQNLRNGDSMLWYVYVEYKDKTHKTISGVDKIPYCWDEYMNVLKELQIP